MSAPPRAERIARWSLAVAERQSVLGDMHEEFVHLSQRLGAAAATRWYWQQTLASIVPNALRRLRNDKRRWAGLTWSCLGVALGVQVAVSFADAGMTRAFDYLLPGLITTFGIWGIVRAVFARRASKPRAQMRASFWIDVALTATVAVNGFAIWADSFWPRLGPVAGVVLDLVIAFKVGVELWPRWPRDAMATAPGEFLVRMTTDANVGRRHRITIAAPNRPLGLSSLVLSAERSTADHWLAALGARFGAPTLRRTFMPEDTVRVYAAVNDIESSAHAVMDVIDGHGRICQTAPGEITTTGLERVIQRTDGDDDDIESLLERHPNNFARVELTLPLAHLEPGLYRLRLTMRDADHSSLQQDEFVVTPPAATEG